MLLWVFILLTSIAIVLIIIGLTKPEESHAALIGFSFLFILSFVLMNVNILNVNVGILYKTGENISTTYTYQSNSSNIDSTNQIKIDNYSIVDENDTSWFGRFLAIASFLGFTFILVGLRGGFKNKNEEED